MQSTEELHFCARKPPNLGVYIVPVQLSWPCTNPRGAAHYVTNSECHVQQLGFQGRWRYSCITEGGQLGRLNRLYRLGVPELNRASLAIPWATCHHWTPTHRTSAPTFHSKLCTGPSCPEDNLAQCICMRLTFPLLPHKQGQDLAHSIKNIQVTLRQQRISLIQKIKFYSRKPL